LNLRRFLARHGVPGMNPILVYQMAKVGSSSIVEALKARKLLVFQLHRMNREHLERMRAKRVELGWHLAPPPAHDILGPILRERLVNRGRRVKVITLVRDPIARNFSSYFEHLDAIWHRENAHATVPLEELHRGFLERFPHDEALTWFDDELRPVFGVDVYEHPFPASGHLRIGDVLVLKSELDDATKCAAVSEFLGLRDLAFRPANVTASKAKGEPYKRFVSTLRLDSAYVDRMLESRYTRHFYTEVEREEMRRKYLRW
jgi:hypothetical protein